MKKKNLILLLIIVFLALFLLSSCNDHGNVLLLIELRLRNQEQDAEATTLAEFSFFVMNKEYITDENGFASVYFKSFDEAFGENLCTFPPEYKAYEPIINNTNNTVFLTFFLEINDNLPSQQVEVPDDALINKKISLASTRQYNNDTGEIRGYVMDIEYNLVEGVDVYFGEEPSYAGKTDAAGEFSLFFKNAYQYKGEKIIDFLYFADDDYKFKVFMKSESFTRDIAVFVVAAPKDSDFDMNTIRAPLSLRCSFHHSGVILPPGYNKNERTIYAEEGKEVIIGVEMYFNGKLVSISDIFGFDIDFLVPNTLIHLKKEGFWFILRYNMAFVEIENDSYLFQGYENLLMEFRGSTDNMEIFLGT